MAPQRLLLQEVFPAASLPLPPLLAVISHKIQSFGAVTDVCSKFQSRLIYNFQKADAHLEAIGPKCQTLMLRLPVWSHHNLAADHSKKKKTHGPVFHCLILSTSIPRSHISQTPRYETAEMDKAAKRPLLPALGTTRQHESKIKLSQHTHKRGQIVNESCF